VLGVRVLVIAPHPDDECTGCGGVIALHLDAGDHVTVIQVTDGRGSRAQGLDAETMARVRLQEGRAAAEALGVNCLEQWGLHEGEWSESDLVARLRDALMRLQPNIIYAPSCIDFHPEHVRVARALAAALDDIAPTMLRVYAISVPLTRTLANCVADTSAVMHLQHVALAAYRTQVVALRAPKRLRHYLANYYGVARSAEEFWEISPRAYQSMMQQGDWLGERAWARELTPYRSLQFRSWSDPLAFWQGGHARQQLFRLAKVT
jgi:LmbE family N-acetylglucosaminyl deacetylase